MLTQLARQTTDPKLNKTVLLLLGLVTFFVYAFAPVLQSVSDSRYTPLTAEHLIWHGTMQLDQSFDLPLDPARYPSQNADGIPYQIAVRDGHFYYAYPPGTTVLIAPAVWALNLAGLRSHFEDWGYDPLGDQRIQRILAPLITSLFVMLVFVMASRFLSLVPATGVAIVVAFGTMAFSTTSRALWSDTIGICLLQGILLLLMIPFSKGNGEGHSSPRWHYTDKEMWSGLLLGTLLAWMIFVRPTYATALIAVLGWSLFYRRSLLIPSLISGVVWAFLFALFLNWQTGSPLPAYNAQGSMVSWRATPQALPGHLFSPSRGLLVLVPVLWFVLWICVRKIGLWRNPLWRLSVAGTLAHLALISCWPMWWGGHCFGPRLFTGALPFLVLGTIVALQIWWPKRTRVSLGALMSLSLLSIIIHSLGAYDRNTERWNWRVVTEEVTAQDMWSVRYPQFLAGILSAPLPTVFPDLPSEKNVGALEFTPVLIRGWAFTEGSFRWSDRTRSLAIFSHQWQAGDKLNLKFYPYLGQGKIATQKVQIRVNKKVVYDEEFTTEEPVTVSLSLPNQPDGRYQIDFLLPNAQSPNSLGQGDDTRSLAIRLEEFWVQRKAE